MLGKKYRPSPGSDVRSAETIRSSFAIREKTDAFEQHQAREACPYEILVVVMSRRLE